MSIAWMDHTSLIQPSVRLSVHGGGEGGASMSPLHFLLVFPLSGFLLESSSVFAINHTHQRFSTEGNPPPQGTRGARGATGI